jgi:hypothetical protein
MILPPLVTIATLQHHSQGSTWVDLGSCLSCHPVPSSQSITLFVARYITIQLCSISIHLYQFSSTDFLAKSNLPSWEETVSWCGAVRRGAVRCGAVQQRMAQFSFYDC